MTFVIERTTTITTSDSTLLVHETIEGEFDSTSIGPKLRELNPTGGHALIDIVDDTTAVMYRVLALGDGFMMWLSPMAVIRLIR
jgi:hypothetical protein